MNSTSFIVDEMTIKVAARPRYEVVLGAGQTYVIDKNTEAMFEINAGYFLFEGEVYIDDVLLDSKNYTSEAGSTIIRLKKDFVDSLETEEHTLMVEFSDEGRAATNFFVGISREEEPEEEIPGVPNAGDFIQEHVMVVARLTIGLPISIILLYALRCTIKR